MFNWFDSETDLTDPLRKIFSRAYGTIVVQQQSFQSIRFKPWPKLISYHGVQHQEKQKHQADNSDDTCLLYYNQPFFHKNFLALKYIISHRGTSFRTFRLAVRILDEVARIKRSDALVCEVTNQRISDRLLTRWGWEEHLQESRGRHFIKRFYGEYPPTLLKPRLSVVSEPQV